MQKNFQMQLTWGINKDSVHIVLHENVSNMGREMKDADLCSYNCFFTYIVIEIGSK